MEKRSLFTKKNVIMNVRKLPRIRRRLILSTETNCRLKKEVDRDGGNGGQRKVVLRLV